MFHTIVFFCYAGLVAILSLRPLGDSGIQHFDKLMHLLVYYIFAVFGYRMLESKRHYCLLCLGIIAHEQMDPQLGRTVLLHPGQTVFEPAVRDLGFVLPLFNLEPGLFQYAPHLIRGDQ